MNLRLRETKVVKKYQEIINEEMKSILENSKDMNIDELWERVPDVILKVAKIVCGVYKTNRNRNG